jgi:D-beta-D-heptose 7-phosphate kinase/D-beta-D-heptose 1-phosphate adenosyltransferase
VKNKIILSHSRLKRIVNSLKKKNKTIVFTNGCFDLLHKGHVSYLAKAKRLGDCLLVAVNSDSSVRSIKGQDRPITSQFDRAQLLASLAMVDLVTIFNEPTPFKLIKLLKPQVLVKGADWQTRNIVGADIIKNYGGKVRRISYLKGYSTTDLIKKIAKAK